MKCLYCTTELPVDGNTKKITCPKCGSEFNIALTVFGGSQRLVPVDPPAYGENNHYDSPTNY